ncbi:hypothetical protein EV401DRAFT_2026238 [Pisolithus croceorrhizus]|nr:hypothetical protein EV401DRAFT_2026238 [Pisolithus croceorrhizus]
MRGQKVTATTKRIFELIHGIFKKRIPIMLVINHLERERDMEDWWRRNQGTLGTSMSGTRHVCVTLYHWNLLLGATSRGADRRMEVG